MGLSAEERVQKMFWAIHNLNHALVDTTYLNSLAEYDDTYGRLALGVQQLRAKIGELWHALLASDSNAGFWFFGGDLDNPVTDRNGAWATAIAHHCNSHREDPDVYRMDPRNGPFNPFNGALCVDGLVRKCGHEGMVMSQVLGIYRNTEYLSYGLRRYDDKLRARFAGVDKLISDIMGICFGIFAHREEYARAYVLNRTLRWVYTGSRDEMFNPYCPDPTAQILLDLCMHHSLSRPMGQEGSTAEVIRWDQWRLQHKPTPQNRIKMAMRIAGRLFHCDHQFAKLMEAAEKLTPRPKSRKIKKVFEQCKRAHANDGSARRHTEDTQLKAHMAVHGYRAYSWLRETT